MISLNVRSCRHRRKGDQAAFLDYLACVIGNLYRDGGKQVGASGCGLLTPLAIQIEQDDLAERDKLQEENEESQN